MSSVRLASSSQIRYERIAYEPEAWELVIDGHPDVEVYHGAAWLRFLERSQGIEPVIARVSVDGAQVGHFVGGIVRRYGIRILGSPLRGWTTQCMGFLLEPGTDRAAVARELAGFAFKELGCSHLEFADRHLSDRSLNESGYSLDVGQSFRSDLRPPEDELFGQMREDARKEIRRALRDGLRAEFTTDPDFAEVHHSFLERVFARQGLAPTYPVERVRQMIAEVLPSGHLKLLVVRSPTDEAVATAISAGRGRMAITVGTAFDRSDRRYHPMSLARWETMRSWKQAGAEEFDFGGGGDYKMKFGPHAVAHHHYFRSRYPWLPAARAGVQRMVRVRQVIRRRR